MLQGAKETFGARITNFDAKTYLKKLPGLLNTPAGRKRVLRDLQILNRLNQIHREGVMTQFEKAGGPGSIPYSTAVSRARKADNKEIMQLRDEFINPNRNKFASMPQASIHKGRRVEDESTGQIFISDGNEWKPEAAK